MELTLITGSLRKALILLILLYIFQWALDMKTKEDNGISHFIEHIMFKGTDKRPNTRLL